MHALGTHCAGQFNLEGDKASLWTDHHKGWSRWCVAQCQRRTMIGDPAGPTVSNQRQLILNERAKALVTMHLWPNRVARSLHACQQRFVELVVRKQRTLPVTLIHASTVDQMQMCNTELRNGAQDAAQHFGTRQGQHHIKAVPQRRWIRKLDRQHDTRGIDGLNLSTALVPRQQAHAQRITHLGTKHSANMVRPPITQTHQPITGPGIIGAKQDQIHTDVIDRLR